MMSRVLDSAIITSEVQSSIHKIYSDIANILCPQPPVLVEIEILGKSHILPPDTNVLIDGNSIAVPKAKLIQAFIYARALFFNQLNPCLLGREEDLTRATAVMLLMDAEHLTAANARKRLLLSCRTNDVVVMAMMRRELVFVDSYLTSRLHRHTKSPTLWSHRRWLLEQFQKAGVARILGDSLRVVLIAAERHPRNYYAWLHLRWLVVHSRREEVEQCMLLDVVKYWAIRHPADTSGFSFLIFLVEYLAEDRKDVTAREDVLTDVLVRTKSFDWTYESVWVFLRTLAASSESQDQRLLFLDTALELITEKNGNVKDIKVLKQARSWYHSHAQKSPTMT